MRPIDKRIEYQQIQAMAHQADGLANRRLQELNEQYNGNESDEFLLGLLSGYANALNILGDDSISQDERAEQLGSIVAFLADKIAQRGI